jgi:hypothetical protein
MGFFFKLLISETQLNFVKSRMSFEKRQRWHLNPIQLRKSTLAAAIVAIYTLINSDLRILTSKFRIPTSDFEFAVSTSVFIN